MASITFAHVPKCRVSAVKYSVYMPNCIILAVKCGVNISRCIALEVEYSIEAHPPTLLIPPSLLRKVSSPTCGGPYLCSQMTISTYYISMHSIQPYSITSCMQCIGVLVLLVIEKPIYLCQYYYSCQHSGTFQC